MRFVSRAALLASAFAALTVGWSPDTKAQETIRYYRKRDPVAKSRGEFASWRNKAEFAGMTFVPLIPSITRNWWIQRLIRNDLKSYLIDFLQMQAWQAMKESSLRRWGPLETIPLDELVDDIRKSPYEIHRNCWDQSRKREASTGWKRNDTVCFSAHKILKFEDVWNEAAAGGKIIALALHEHLHHFGIADADNRIYFQLADRLRFALEHHMPMFETMQVTSRFASFRRAFQRGDELVLDAKAYRLSCDLELRPRAESLAVPAGTGDPLARILARLPAWLGHGLTLRRSLLGSNRYDLDGLTRYFVRIGTAGNYEWMFGASDFPAWIFARSVTPGRIILEIAFPDKIASEGYLPSAVTEGSAVGYADCTMSEQ
jgi:hypothetical protein